MRAARMMIVLVLLWMATRPVAAGGGWRMDDITIEGVKPGMTRQQVEARFGRLVRTDRDFTDTEPWDYYAVPGTRREVGVIYEQQRQPSGKLVSVVHMVCGTSLELQGRVVAVAGISVTRIKRVLGAPTHEKKERDLNPPYISLFCRWCFISGTGLTAFCDDPFKNVVSFDLRPVVLLPAR